MYASRFQVLSLFFCVLERNGTVTSVRKKTVCRKIFLEYSGIFLTSSDYCITFLNDTCLKSCDLLLCLFPKSFGHLIYVWIHILFCVIDGFGIPMKLLYLEIPFGFLMVSCISISYHFSGCQFCIGFKGQLLNSNNGFN